MKELFKVTIMALMITGLVFGTSFADVNTGAAAGVGSTAQTGINNASSTGVAAAGTGTMQIGQGTETQGISLEGSGAVSGAGASADNYDYSTNISEKGYPIQGNVPFAAMPGYFGDNNKPGHQFIPLAKLLMYNTDWEVKENYPLTRGNNLNITPHAKKVAKEDRSKVVTCTKEVFDITKVELKLLAVGTVNSTNKDVISSDLLDKVIFEASKYGATHVQFMAEGTNTELQSSGWGIGFAYTKASDTTMSTGGTGFSTGWAGYQNLPWQQFMFLKITDPNAVGEEADISADEVATTELDTQVEKAIQNKTVN